MRIQRISNNVDTVEIDGEVDLSLIMPLINKYRAKKVVLYRYFRVFKQFMGIYLKAPLNF